MATSMESDITDSSSNPLCLPTAGRCDPSPFCTGRRLSSELAVYIIEICSPELDDTRPGEVGRTLPLLLRSSF
jgi:hypothetical protein